MTEALKTEPEQSRDAAVSEIHDCRIDHPRQAPLKARMIRLVWFGGEELYENYRDSYNRMVGSLAECVKHDAMSLQKAKEIIKECRKF